MRFLEALSREGAMDILARLCVGEARFRELNNSVVNTRTLTRRLRELLAQGLVQKNGVAYKITDEGFDIALKIVSIESMANRASVNRRELDKIRDACTRMSLKRLTEFFHEEFGDELASIVIYGSAVKDSFQIKRSDLDFLYILEDDSLRPWQREASLFGKFHSAWEYKACDYWFRRLGAYGHPEISTVSLSRTVATTYQPVYLDMLSYRAVLYDKGEFFHRLMVKLEDALKALRSVRVEYPDGTSVWSLKPDAVPGEIIEIRLR